VQVTIGFGDEGLPELFISGENSALLKPCLVHPDVIIVVHPISIPRVDPEIRRQRQDENL